MRILHLNTHVNLGGIASYILNLSDALGKKGAECIVASGGGDLEEEFVKRGITHKKLDIRTKSSLSPKILKSVFTLTKIVKRDKIDIIHAHTRVSQIAASLTGRITGVRYVTTCHGFFKTRLRKVFDTWGVKVIAISEPVRRHLKDDLGVDEKRIALIYNGVDVKRFLQEYSREEIDLIKRSYGLKGGPVVGTIGRLSPVKGQKFFIEAMKDVIAKSPDVEGIVVGDGPEENALKDLARSLGIEGHVHFFKSDPDTYKYLSVMDVFVFPSIKEGLGMALLEALVAKRPCVASDIGGISDVIKNGFNGLLVPVGDVSAITGAVLHLLEDESLKKKIGANGRNTVSERFSIDLMATKILELYKEVLTLPCG